MDVSDIALFAETLAKAMAHYPAGLHLQQAPQVDPAVVQDAWTLAAAQGWAAVYTEDEDLGGAGLGMAGAVALARATGAHLFPAPLMAGTVLLPALAQHDPAFAPFAADILGGEAQVVLATRLGGPTAAPLFVSGAGTGAMCLAVVEDDRSVTFTLGTPQLAPRGSFDPTTPTDEVTALSPLCPALHLSQRDADGLLVPAHIWIAAELVGVARQALDLSLTHARERQQFGRPIGANQAVKHRLADLFIATELAEALTDAAARAHDARAPDAQALAHAARSAATDAGLGAAGYAIQLHGGLGFSWEHPVHLYYKRARRLAGLLGYQDGALDALARITLTQVA